MKHPILGSLLSFTFLISSQLYAFPKSNLFPENKDHYHLIQKNHCEHNASHNNGKPKIYILETDDMDDITTKTPYIEIACDGDSKTFHMYRGEQKLDGNNFAPIRIAESKLVNSWMSKHDKYQVTPVSKEDLAFVLDTTPKTTKDGVAVDFELLDSKGNSLFHAPSVLNESEKIKILSSSDPLVNYAVAEKKPLPENCCTNIEWHVEIKGDIDPLHVFYLLALKENSSKNCEDLGVMGAEHSSSGFSKFAQGLGLLSFGGVMLIGGVLYKYRYRLIHGKTDSEHV
jgi:hypothetical protein